MFFPPYTYFLCFFNHHSMTVFIFSVISFMHQLLLLPYVHGDTFVLSWMGDKVEALCAEARCSPSLMLCSKQFSGSIIHTS